MFNGLIDRDPDKYTKTNDLYGIGATLYDLITFRTLEGQTRDNIPYNESKPPFYVPRGELNYFTSGNTCFDDVVRGLLVLNPNNRLTASQALQLLEECQKTNANNL